MTIQEKITILKSYFLFSDLSNSELEEIAQEAQEKVFPPKKLLITQDEPTAGVYIIYKGLVKSYLISIEGKIIPLRATPPMGIVGEVEIIDDHPRVNVEALQETHVLWFTKPYFKTLLKKPSVTFHLLSIVTQKLRNANRREAEQISLSLKERTWDILQTLSQHFQNKEISLSQEEFAMLVGATRARVTEILNDFEKEKLISLAHKKITVL